MFGKEWTLPESEPSSFPLNVQLVDLLHFGVSVTSTAGGLGWPFAWATVLGSEACQ